MNGNFKKLALDRDEIINAIKKYCNANFNNYDVENFVDCGNNRKRVNIQTDDDNFFIDFHFNTDDTTTIDLSSGKKLEIKNDISEFIKDICVEKTGENSSLIKNPYLVIKGIQLSDYNDIIKVINTCKFYKEDMEHTPEENRYRFQGMYGAKITVTYYASNKVVLQGKPSLIFAEIADLFMNLVDVKEYPDLLSYRFNTSEVGAKDLEIQAKSYLTNAYDKISNETLKRTILQAVFYLNVDGSMPEYTSLVFPAYRCFEGHMKHVLLEAGIEMTQNRFCMFNSNKNLKQEYKNIIITKVHDSTKAQNIIKYLEKSYKYFADKRHIYFHWNNPKPDILLDATATVDTLIGAKGLIHETLGYIEEYYSIH